MIRPLTPQDVLKHDCDVDKRKSMHDCSYVATCRLVGAREWLKGMFKEHLCAGGKKCLSCSDCSWYIATIDEAFGRV